MSFKQVLDSAKDKTRSLGRYLSASKKRQRITAAVLILACAAAGQIVYLSFAATTEYSPIPQVAAMQKLTEEVIQDTTDYAAMPDTISSKKGAAEPNAAKATKKQELIAKVKERKEAYKIALQYDPQAAADAYLKQDTIDKLPTEAKADLEQATVLEGVWMQGRVLYNMSQPAQASPSTDRQVIKIQLPDESRVNIYGKALPEYATGAPVKLVGTRMGDSFVAALPKTITDIAPTGPNPSILSPEKIEAIKQNINQAQQLLLEQLNQIVAHGGSYTDVVYCESDMGCLGDDSDIADRIQQKTILAVVYRFPGPAADLLRSQRDYPTNQEINMSLLSIADTYSKMSYGKFNPKFNRGARFPGR